MLPASNKGVGMNMGFPDVCLTPAVPAPIPIPYPNMAMNAMAVPFCPTILLTCMPALNMASIIPMTLGDQPGVANPLFMQMGRYTMGNPKVLLDALPAINLTCPTSGNMMNNPVGAVLVPSVTNVMFSYRAEALAATVAAPNPDALPSSGGEEIAPSGSHHRGITAADLAHSAAVNVDSITNATAHTLLDGGVGYLAIRVFHAAVPSLVFHAVHALRGRGMRSLLIDLRGNPGGEVKAFLELAGDFLEPGTLIVTLTDGDGDELTYRATQPAPYRLPVAVLVDGSTASAAELFAACLKAHGRATIVGETTYGKGVAQALVPSAEGRDVHGTVASFTFPDGEQVHGMGVQPDIPWAGTDLDDVCRRVPCLVGPSRTTD